VLVGVAAELRTASVKVGVAATFPYAKQLLMFAPSSSQQ
jgi:hypothetical protein